MQQFRKILKFELKNYLTNKIFVGVTLFLAALIAVVMFFPRIKESFTGNVKPESSGVSADADAPKDPDAPLMLLSAASAEDADDLWEAFSAAFGDYAVQATDENKEAVKEKIINQEAECAFVIDSPVSYTYYVNNLSMYDSNTDIADEILLNLARVKAMTASGMSAADAQAALAIQVAHETESLGKDQMQNFFYTYIMIFALYMVILLYGQMVATNVATEKSSRAMELLITSARPVNMMFGKVIASCLAGLIQLVAVFGSALLFYRMNEDYWGGNEIVASVFDMPLDLFVYMLVFFALGFFIYAFMFGAIGSTASKLEDINTSVMPVTLLFIVGFLVVMMSMSSGNVDTVLMKVCSFVPFTSPMAMFTRIAMSSVPFYEIAVSILILVASVAGVGVIAAKIYRVGVLLYGTTPKIRNIIKAVKNG